jgi:hypothetical protein
MNTDQGKADWTYQWPSVPELRVLITLGSEAMEHSKALDHGLARPHRQRHHEPYALSYSLPIHFFTFHFHHFLTHFVTKASTLDPGHVTKIRLVRFVVWIDSTLAPGEASPRLSLIYSPLFPHSRLFVSVLLFPHVTNSPSWPCFWPSTLFSCAKFT